MLRITQPATAELGLELSGYCVYCSPPLHSTSECQPILPSMCVCLPACVLSEFRRGSASHEWLHVCAKYVQCDDKSDSDELLLIYSFLPGTVLTNTIVESLPPLMVEPIITPIFF